MPKQKSRRPVWTASALALLAAAIVAVASGAAQAALTAATSTRIPAHARITLRPSEYGKVISDTRGQVLYLFAADKGPTSTCYNACAKAWPPLLTKRAPTAAAALNAKLLGTTKRKDGTLQVTYNRHPLYYFEGDKGRKVMCQHANMHGGFWYVVKANGTANLAKSKTHM